MSPEESRDRAIALVLTIACANALIFGEVWLCLKFGYKVDGTRKTLDLPSRFLSSEIVVLAVGFLVPGLPRLWRAVNSVLFNGDRGTRSGPKPPDEPGGSEDQESDLPLDTLEGSEDQESDLRLSRRISLWLLRIVVFGLTAGTIYALRELVSATGGLMESPFTPLMTAPAVFGPFMARHWLTMVVVVFFGAFSVWSFDFWEDASSISALADTWVYATVATVVLFLATGISARRRKLEID